MARPVRRPTEDSAIATAREKLAEHYEEMGLRHSGWGPWEKWAEDLRAGRPFAVSGQRLRTHGVHEVDPNKHYYLTGSGLAEFTPESQ